ncbi:MAG: PleD family two-component system response regulator [Elainellaceae cyanobacterium]
MTTRFTAQTSPLTLLLADDDLFTRRFLTACFAQEGGYCVVEVDNGAACLEAYHTVEPDIILLDASMPTMDGFECCQRLRAHRPAASLPILMITGLNDSVSVDRAFDAGATDYVTKPIHWPVLRQRVRLYIERHQLHKDLERANQLLHKMAALDGLTQISNRRSFDGRLQREWQRLARESRPLALALFDVDFFKVYNDTYGHLAGDNCLRQIAAAAEQTVRRPADLVARYGGEEFALLMPNTGEAGAVAIAHQLCHAVRQLGIYHGASPMGDHVSLSVGVASLIPTAEEPAESLINAADVALYRAKEQGRDCVVPYSQEFARSSV